MPEGRMRALRLSHPARFVTTIVAVLLGLLLLGLAVPRTIAAWWGLDAEPALDKMQAGQPPTELELDVAKRGLRNALHWVPTSRRMAALGALELLEARMQPLHDPKRAALLAEAEGHLTEALVRGSADSTAWYHLALLRTMNDAGGRQVASAVVESLRMAPRQRDLWMPRATLLLRYWRFLDEGELQEFRSQLRTIYALSPAIRHKLFDAARELGELRFAAAAVGDDLLANETFEQLKTELGPGISGRARGP